MIDLWRSKKYHNLISYVLISALIILALLINLNFKQIIGKESIFLLLLPAVVFAAWAGGFITGLGVSFISAILIVFLLQLENISSSLWSQLLLFVAESVLVSKLIDKLRQTDLLSQFQKSEKKHEKMILDLELKLATANAEIKARDEFLSIASHELKTPLTSMLLQLQRALHNIRNVSLANFSVENLLKMLENAESQTARLSKMINDLLNVSLITTKRMDLELEEVDLSKLTKVIAESFAEKLAKEGYAMELHLDTPVLGKWDKVRLEQVVVNLISNAIKYGDKKPIKITVTNHGSTGKIIVEDHGIGIPSEKKGQIFELFERVAPASKIEGLGVGLYITNQIVRAHHGKILVDSEENMGTTFTIELPLVPQVN